jgi:hypothetical protein
VAGYPSPDNDEDRARLYRQLGFDEPPGDLSPKPPQLEHTLRPVDKMSALESALSSFSEKFGNARVRLMWEELGVARSNPDEFRRWLSESAPSLTSADQGLRALKSYLDALLGSTKEGEGGLLPEGRIYEDILKNTYRVIDEIPGASDPASKPQKPEGDEMSSTPSREEIDAKLALVEARTEARFAELSGKLDRISDGIATFNATVQSELLSVRNDIKEARADVREVKQDNRNTRWTIIITVIASVLAALGALWTTQGSLLSAFQVRLAMPNSPSPSSSPPSQIPQHP